MKILIVDIETGPHLSYHFKRWQENIPPEHTVVEGGTICWAAQWFGSSKMMFKSYWSDGFVPMLEGIYNLLDEADVVVGFNSDAFDVKMLNAEFIRQGWSPPSPYQKVDLYKQVKRHFRFSSNRLKHVLKELGLTPKVEDIDKGLALWIDVVHHKKATARNRMKAYNKQDVASTVELYEALLGWIDGHPNWGLFVNDGDGETPVCPNCKSESLHRHKVRRTSVRVYQQYQCQGCGKYSRGRKNIGPKGTDNGVLV